MTRRALLAVSAQWPAPTPWGSSPPSSHFLATWGTRALAWPPSHEDIAAAARELAAAQQVPADAGLVVLALTWVDPEPTGHPPPPRRPDWADTFAIGLLAALLVTALTLALT